MTKSSECDLIVCAIDPSISSTGLAIVQVEDISQKKFRLLYKTTLVNNKTFKNRWEKKEVARELFEYALKDRLEHISFCIIENYSYGSKGYLSDAGELVGLFKHYLWLHKISFDMIAPSTVKRIVGDHGQASKEEVAANLSKYITNHSSFMFNNLDETDAVAIAIAYLVDIHDPSKRTENKRDAGKNRSSAKRIKSK